MAVIDETLDFVHTGPETLAGRFLRSFWQPVYRSRDLEAGRAVPIKIMCEDFTLYRGESGEAHVIADRCAHRGTQLSTGWVEGDSVRCFYHGWKYDASGQCIEQPGEDEAFKTKVKIKSYPVQEYLGLIFAYLGEGEPRPFKRFPDFEREGVLDVALPEIWPCNYFNRIDNACDIAHVNWAHRESIFRTNKLAAYVQPTVVSEETDYGIKTSRIVPGRPTTFFHFHMPNINQVRAFSRVEGSREDATTLAAVDELFWRVPIDDENGVTFVVDFVQITGDAAEAYRERRQQTQEGRVVDLNAIAESILAGKMRISEVDDTLSLPKRFWIEDYVAQVGQGPIADRTSERLGRNDVGVILLRKLWQRELKALAEGEPLRDWSMPENLADMSVVTV